VGMTDPIADLLTRIRNALQARHARLSLPASRIKREIVRILKEESFVENYRVEEDGKSGVLVIQLRYLEDGTPVILGLDRISKPGLRVYCGKGEIPVVRGGMGTCVLSTSKGILTGADSAKQGLGGEILFRVY